MKIHYFSDINESIFPKFIKKPDRLYNKVSKLLNNYKNELLELEKIEKFSLDQINSKKEYFENQLNEDIVSRLNIDGLLNNLRTITGSHKGSDEELKDKIEKLFNDFLSTLKDRIISYYSNKNIELDDEDISNEFKELKKLKKKAQLQTKIPKKQFDKEKTLLQLELLKMQEWYKSNNEKIILLFEGRDAAGKGSCINTITENLDPKYYNIVTFGIPSEYDKKNWFERYKKELPKSGHMTLYDRSWYNRAVNDPVMGYCTREEYENFMKQVVPFENNLKNQGYHLIKFWFSITKNTQKLRFEMRRTNPLKYWKFSENDLQAMNKWEKFTAYKEEMFRHTSTEENPWVVVESNSKRVAQLNSMRYILKNIPYENKNYDRIGEIYPETIIPMT